MLVNERPAGSKHPRYDTEAALKEADARLGLERVIEQYGHSPEKSGGSWKAFTCPFCGKKKKAGVFERGGTKFFKCQSTSCATAAKALPAVQFIMQMGGLSSRDAFEEYLKQAGVWRERERLKGGEKVTTKSTESTEGTAEGEERPAEVVEAAAAEVAEASETEQKGQNLPEAHPSAALADAPKAEAAPSPSSPVAEASPAPGVGQKSEARSQKSEVSQAEKETPKLPLGVAALREFFGRLTLSAEDEERLWRKRGLSSRTVAALQFRSNPRTNEVVLRELADQFGPEELVASGLWKAADRRRRKSRRPNTQFCGAGIMGKAPAGFKPDRMQWVDEDGNQWGWCQPILIPYFDELGQLQKLRPHKGGASGETVAGQPLVYIPRAVKPGEVVRERFDRVVITEGEFKAAALWQVLAEEQWGVAALPGISFARHYEMREVLDEWLRMVRCRHVIVAFDHEEKGDPALSSYKQDRRKRFDTLIWARYLATDLANKLHVRAEVCVLPDAWKNANGKADWDGALAQLIHEEARNE